MGKMRRTLMEHGVLKLFLVVFISVLVLVESPTDSGDVAAMMALKQSLKVPTSLGWTNPDPCRWEQVSCSDGRVTAIQIGNQGLSGTLPSDLQYLTALVRLELMYNNISGTLPSLGGLGSLQILRLSNNQFSYIPVDFFSGLSSLQVVELDDNPFSAWEIPVSLQNATSLVNFSANSANITGNIPDFVGGTVFPSLTNLHLAFNNLEGGLPASFAGSLIQSLWLNGQEAKLNGSIQVLQDMTSLTEVWLHSNAFTGTLPDLSGLNNLQSFSVRDNQLTGPVPASLVSLPSLKIVNLTNNFLQGSTPKFPSSLAVDMAGINSFCLSTPGAACDSRVNILLSIAQDMDYPIKFAQYWKGNDPCASWFGISCSNGNIFVIKIQKMGLTGMISPDFSKLHTLQKLILVDNNLTGTIPEKLTTLSSLTELDVSNNQLSGQVPKFGSNTVVNTKGNPDIGKAGSSGSVSANGTKDGGQSPNGRSSLSVGVEVGLIIGCVFLVFLVGLLVFCIRRRNQNVESPNVSNAVVDRNGVRRVTSSVSNAVADRNGMRRVTSSVRNAMVDRNGVHHVTSSVSNAIVDRNGVHRVTSSVSNAMVHRNGVHRVTSNVSNAMVDRNGVRRVTSSVNNAMVDRNGVHHVTSSVSNAIVDNIQMVDTTSMVISIEVLRNATGNFSEDNILGSGSFAIVYKGKLDGNNEVAVKRMNSGIIIGQGLAEFKSEIDALRYLQHRHLVPLIGYCLDENEKILVYEYMPQGTLNRHLFDWTREGLSAMLWERRLSIALDVARGVEYLHGLARQSFIHRDLKPSNILLGNDMRAKVADFGFVRLVPEGEASVSSRVAGTFGYMDPEYAVTGQVSTKSDVYSFGVILMELITGRRAFDRSQPEERRSLVTWFRRMHLNGNTSPDQFIDSTIARTEENLASVRAVAELACQCCVREPRQRPNMGHSVNVLSSLTDPWRPSDQDSRDIGSLDHDMTLSQMLQDWQPSEGSHFTSEYVTSRESMDNTQISDEISL